MKLLKNIFFSLALYINFPTRKNTETLKIRKNLEAPAHPR